MNWNNLIKGICINECNEPLESRDRMVFCKYCDFKIRKSKYMDLIKGKESKAYKGAVAKIDKIKKYKEKMKEAVKVNVSERESNLRRMLAKGKITQEEFNLKTKK